MEISVEKIMNRKYATDEPTQLESSEAEIANTVDKNVRNIGDRRNSIVDYFYKKEKTCTRNDNDTIKCSCPDFTPYKSERGNSLNINGKRREHPEV